MSLAELPLPLILLASIAVLIASSEIGRDALSPVLAGRLAISSTDLVLIQDLDRPRVGFIMVSQQPIQDVAATLEAFPH
jgi:hypothetical protein